MTAPANGAISLFGTAQAPPGGAGAALARGPKILPRRRFDFAAAPAVTRAAQIARTLDQAGTDSRFCDHVARADAARDAADWTTAETQYGEALSLYPLHWGFCVQRAHAIKEQGNYPGAEAWYRSAVALGAPANMVDQHLAYVARLNGAVFARSGTPDLAVVPLLAPPTLHDIGLLGRLVRGPGLARDDLALPLLRDARDNRAVLIRMIEMPEFTRSNRTFLEILRGE